MLTLSDLAAMRRATKTLIKEKDFLNRKLLEQNVKDKVLVPTFVPNVDSFLPTGKKE